MEVFEYPLRSELFQLIQNKRELKILLEAEAAYLRIVRQHFKLSMQLQKYIYARCRKCRSFLKFKREQNGFVLKSFSFSHHHQHKRKSNQIQDFIKGMPLTMSTQSLMQITTKTFNISNDKFYYHHRKLWYQKSDFKELVKELDQENHQTRLVPFPLEDGQLPDIFLTASPAMISNFKKFGEKQFVTFDVTYNLIKQVKIEKGENNQTKRKKWGLGLFLGKNNHNKALVFCICILNTETKDSFMGIFKSFLDMMNGEPSVFITDEQTSIESALKQLKADQDYHGEHLLDTFHIIRNILKKTRKQQLIQLFKEAIFAKTHEQFKKRMEQAYQLCSQSQQISIYNRFVSSCDKYCLSQTPLCFHGISISTSFGEKVNDCVKTFLPRELPFKAVVRKVLKVVMFLEEKSHEYKLCKVPYQSVFQWKQLKVLRYTLCQTVFNAFLKNYVDSLSKSIQQEGDMWTVDNYQLAIKDNKLFCACGYSQKCGIPCTHLLKAIIATREDIQNYINDRWKVSQQQNKSNLIISKGRPRNSRRQ